MKKLLLNHEARKTDPKHHRSKTHRNTRTETRTGTGKKTEIEFDKYSQLLENENHLGILKNEMK